MDSVDQDQTAQNVQSDLWSTLSTLSFYIITECFFILQWKYIFSQWKNTFYLFGSVRVNSSFHSMSYLHRYCLCIYCNLWMKWHVLVAFGPLFYQNLWNVPDDDDDCGTHVAVDELDDDDEGNDVWLSSALVPFVVLAPPTSVFFVLPGMFLLFVSIFYTVYSSKETPSACLKDFFPKIFFSVDEIFKLIFCQIILQRSFSTKLIMQEYNKLCLSSSVLHIVTLYPHAKRWLLQSSGTLLTVHLMITCWLHQS